MRGILQTLNTHPSADGARVFELSVHVGELFYELEKFLFGSQVVTLRVETRIKLQPHAAKRIGRVGVIVEGDDPQPTTFEDVMQCAFREPIRMPKFLLRWTNVIETRNVNQMGENRARVREAITMPPVEFVGKQ